MSESKQQPTIDQIVNYFFILTEQEIAKNYAEEKREEIMKKFRNTFTKLITQYDDNPAKKYHAINPVFLIALNEVQEISTDELLKQMMNVYKAMLHEIFTTQQKNYAKAEDPWLAIVASLKGANKIQYENEYFQCKTVVDEPVVYGFDLNRCIYYEIFKENNQEKLAPLLCEYDFLLANYLKQWTRFGRTDTIAEGKTSCTFRYYKK